MWLAKGQALGPPIVHRVLRFVFCNDLVRRMEVNSQTLSNGHDWHLVDLEEYRTVLGVVVVASYRYGRERSWVMLESTIDSYPV